MLEGKKTLVKGLKGKKGSYDAYLIPEGIEGYSYTKDGKEIKGFQYKVKLEFPKKENVLLLCVHIGIINLTEGNTEILERSVVLWQQSQLIYMQG